MGIKLLGIWRYSFVLDDKAWLPLRPPSSITPVVQECTTTGQHSESCAALLCHGTGFGLRYSHRQLPVCDQTQGQPKHIPPLPLYLWQTGSNAALFFAPALLCSGTKPAQNLSGVVSRRLKIEFALGIARRPFEPIGSMHRIRHSLPQCQIF